MTSAIHPTSPAPSHTPIQATTVTALHMCMYTCTMAKLPQEDSVSCLKPNCGAQRHNVNVLHQTIMSKKAHQATKSVRTHVTDAFDHTCSCQGECFMHHFRLKFWRRSSIMYKMAGFLLRIALNAFVMLTASSAAHARAE